MLNPPSRAKLLRADSEGRTHEQDALTPTYIGFGVSTTKKETSMHSFDPEIAKKVGVNAAVIYQNIVWWTQKNAANKQNVRDGHVWTYNSRTAFGRLFPYLTQSQIKTAISKLVDTGLLLKGEYNVANYDKTNWYSPSISAEWLENPIGYKSPMDWSETANGLVENRQPIPVSKPDIKPDTLFGEKSPKQQTIKRSISLPDGWVPSNQNIEDAMKRGFSTEETNNEAEQFRNYHQSKGSAFKDWDAAWRTWLGNAKKFARSRPARNGGGHNALMAGFASYAAQLKD